jgi:pyruvate dehydrogenase E1 component alpha subunit
MPDPVRYVEGYGIHAEAVDGNDLQAVALAAKRAVTHARTGAGPAFLQCATYRWYGHNIGDPGAYRPANEVAAWRARDPVARVRGRLLETGGATEERLSGIESAVTERIARAIAWAEAQPEPPAEWAFEDLYSEPSFAGLAGGVR